MSIWAALSLIPGILHFLLGIYIILKRKQNPLNKIFTLYILSLILWCLSEFIHRSDISSEAAYFWIHLGGLGWCYMFSLWVHFVLIFARRKKTLKSKLTWFVLYGISTVILILFLTTNLIYEQQPAKKYFGYTALPGNYVWIYLIYYVILILVASFILIQLIRKGTQLERKQAKPILVGTSVPLVLATATNVIFPKSNVSPPELGTTFSIIWAVSVFYAVLKYKLFIIESSVENSIQTPPKYDLKPGFCYYVPESKPDKGYDIFHDQITHNHYGFCVTKLIPEQIRKKYELLKTPILRLTFSQSHDTISPKDLDGLVSLVSQFVREMNDPFLFVDCIDQIKFVNGMKKTIELIADFHKLCFETNAVILLSINPSMFSKQQWADLNKELIRVDYP